MHWLWQPWVTPQMQLNPLQHLLMVGEVLVLILLGGLLVLWWAKR